MNGYIISDVLTAMQAMHRRELEVYYQPKIDATTSRVKSAEALIRWVKEDGSVILPQQFLPAMEQTGAITLDSSILYDYNSSNLSKDGQSTLKDFLPKYFDVVLSDKYIDYISEIIIEGHTDTVGSYTYNLNLSQARAESVASYCFGDGQSLFSDSLLDQIRSLVTVSGRSWSHPIYNADGTVNQDASRRVEIKFRLSDEEMISQMLSVLEQYD